MAVAQEAWYSHLHEISEHQSLYLGDHSRGGLGFLRVIVCSVQRSSAIFLCESFSWVLWVCFATAEETELEVLKWVTRLLCHEVTVHLTKDQLPRFGTVWNAEETSCKGRNDPALDRY